MDLRLRARTIPGAVSCPGCWDLPAHHFFPCLEALPAARHDESWKPNCSRGLPVHNWFRKATRKLPCGHTTEQFQARFSD